MERINTVKSNVVEDKTPTSDSIVTYESQNGVAVVTLNDPKSLNSLSKKLIEQLLNALNRAKVDPKIKVVLLKANGKVFCAGANIKEFVNDTLNSRLLSDHFMEMKVFFKYYDKPIIAAVHNLAYGGGFELALLADIIVANKDCKFALPEIKLGLFPGLAGTLVSKVIGRYNANKLFFTGEPITADEAKTMMIVSTVTGTVESCHRQAFELAEKIATFSVYSLIAAKRAAKFSFEESSSLALANESNMFNPLLESKGAKEGISAFVEKRKPDFADK
jgi:enoyl-CoA hydratase/carnithine racemase